MNTTPIQRYSNERDELAWLLPEPVERDLPGDRQRQLQEFMMSEIHQDLRAAEQAPRRAPKRRFVLATSALAAVAVAAVAIGTGVGQGTDGSSALPGTAEPTATGLAPVAQTFELAADYAAARPFTPPRPDQWIYIQNRELAPSSLAKDKGQNPDVTTQTWIRADGKKMAGYNPENGKLQTWNQASDYPTLSTLPTDPQALLSLLRAQLEATPADTRTPLTAPHADTRAPYADTRAPHAVTARTPEDWNAALFSRIFEILDANLLPPAVTAALWRAAALIPGVTQASGTIEVDGRQVIAVGRIQEGWQFEQLLLDPNSHEFVGYRSLAVKNFTYTTGPNGPVTEKKGEVQFKTTRLAAKIVDAAGQTS
jgi:hypothetical protein